MMFLLLYILCKLATTNLQTVNHIVWQDVKLEVCFFIKNLAVIVATRELVNKTHTHTLSEPAES